MAVDVQSVTSSYEERVRLVRTETLVQLRQVLAEQLKARGREEVLTDLRRLRKQFRKQGREDMEDIVLDGMDMVTGWTGTSSSRL